MDRVHPLPNNNACPPSPTTPNPNTPTTNIFQLRVVKAFRSSIDDYDDRRSITSSQSCHSMRGGLSTYRLYHTPSSQLNLSTTTGGPGADTKQRSSSVALFNARGSSPQPYPHFYHHQQPHSNGKGASTGVGSARSRDSTAESTTERTPLTSNAHQSPPTAHHLPSVYVHSSNSGPAAKPPRGLGGAAALNAVSPSTGGRGGGAGHVVVENGGSGGTPIRTGPAGDRREKIPLVQRWSPSGGGVSSAGGGGGGAGGGGQATGTTGGTALTTKIHGHMGKSMSLDAPVSIAHV